MRGRHCLQLVRSRSCTAPVQGLLLFSCRGTDLPQAGAESRILGAVQNVSHRGEVVVSGQPEYDFKCRRET